jgi:nitroreductase
MAVPEFFDVIKTRRTVRSYKAEPVRQEDIQDLIDLAVLAPTGMNAQPWEFTVVTNNEVMRKVNSIVVEILRGPEVQQALAEERIRQMIHDPAFDIFYKAPALIVISCDTKVPGGMIDCQLAAENLFLAASAKGLGTCYMGFLLLAAENPDVRKLLAVHEGHAIVAAMIIGHPDVRPEGPPQRNPPRIEWVR